MYTKAMIDYIAKGYAWQLSKREVKSTSPRTNYIPHHRVTNISKPNKVQIVLNTVATCSGTSLN